MQHPVWSQVNTELSGLTMDTCSYKPSTFTPACHTHSTSQTSPKCVETTHSSHGRSPQRLCSWSQHCLCPSGHKLWTFGQHRPSASCLHGKWGNDTRGLRRLQAQLAVWELVPLPRRRARQPAQVLTPQACKLSSWAKTSSLSSQQTTPDRLNTLHPLPFLCWVRKYF